MITEPAGDVTTRVFDSRNQLVSETDPADLYAPEGPVSALARSGTAHQQRWRVKLCHVKKFALRVRPQRPEIRSRGRHVVTKRGQQQFQKQRLASKPLISMVGAQGLEPWTR